MFAQAVWFLAPGLLVGLTLVRRRLVAAHYVVPVAGLVGCVLGYVAFWGYFADRRMGLAYSVVTIALSIAAAGLIIVRRENRQLLRAADVAGPLVLLYLVSLFYGSVTFACSVTSDVVDSNQLCHLHGLTGDNVLPQIFADNVYHGTPKALTWTWQGSDRPPLQAGAVLMQTPLTQAAGWHITSYQSLATLMQVLWVPAIWALCRSVRLSGRRLAIVLTLCVFSGLMMYNSVFTWPKLLAAALLMVAFGLFFFEKVTPFIAGLAGLAIGAAMMAHPGVAFTLVPMGVVLALPRFRPNWRAIAVTAAIVVIIMAPWQVYQTKYDPPGNRLLKWHLAGVIAVDDRSVSQAVYDAYTGTPAATIAHNKLVNVGTIFGLQERRYHLAGTGITSALRDEEFRYVIFGLSIFNLGWLALLFPAIRRRLRHAFDLSRVRLMLIVAGTSLPLWAMVIFIPGDTVTYQGSYATLILLFAACGAVLSAFPRNVVRLLVTFQVGYFAVMWVAAVWRHNYLHPSYVALSLAGALAVLGFLGLVGSGVAAGPDEPAAEPPGGPAGAPPAARTELEQVDLPR